MFYQIFPVLTRDYFLSLAWSLFSKCHLAVHRRGKWNSNLIKMLCSLPNSSSHIWFSLFWFCGWAMTSIQLNQSFLKGRPYGSHFYMLFGMTRQQQECVLTEGSTETLMFACYSHEHASVPRWRRHDLGFSRLQPTVYEPNCHFLLTFDLAPVDSSSFYLLKLAFF